MVSFVCVLYDHEVLHARAPRLGGKAAEKGCDAAATQASIGA